LNDQDVETHAERQRSTLVVEADYTAWLAKLSSTRVRFIVSELVEKEPWATMLTEERYDFRTKRVYDEYMKIAYGCGKLCALAFEAWCCWRLLE
jgi:hypothetical protein